MKLILTLLAAPLLAAQSPFAAHPSGRARQQTREAAQPPRQQPQPAPSPSPSKHTGKAANEVAPNESAAKDSARPDRPAPRAEAPDRRTAVNLLLKEIGRARFFGVPAYSARVLTEAADALWPQSDYSHVAEKALRDAWAYTGRDLADQLKSQARERGTPEREHTISAHEQRTALRSDILAVAQRHKPELVKEFLDGIEEKEEDARAAHNLPIAFGTGSLRQQQLANAALRLAASDPARAVELASSALDYGMPQELQGIFSELAKSGPAHARELFRRAVPVFAADTSVNIYDAVFLASYLKSSREPEPDAALVRTFLDAALDRMLRLRQQHTSSGNSSEGERSAMLMSLGHLQPLFQSYHPERLGELVVLAQQLRPELPAEQFESDAVGLGSPDNPYTPENLLSRAATEKNAGLRDEFYLQAALKFAGEKKFDRALDAALSARDAARRDPFVTYIRYQHATHLAAAGELDETNKVLEKIDDPELRAEATAALSTAARKKKDLTPARYALDQTVKALGTHTGSAAHARAYLWLASAYALVDAERGYELMQSAVRAANSAPLLIDLRGGRRVIHVSERVREAIVTGGSGAGDFRPGFRALARADFPRTVQIAEGFTNNLFRGLAIVAAADSVLKQRPAAQKKSASGK